MFWCAGANSDYLSQCPKSEQVKYESLGGIILLSAALGGASMFVAIRIIWPGSDWGLHAALAGAACWFMFIFLLDRYIVAGIRDSETLAKRLAVALPRIALGVVIGLIVATPLHLKMFESEINEVIANDIKRFAEADGPDDGIATDMSLQNTIYKLNSDLLIERRSVQRKLDAAQAYVDSLTNEFDRERGKGGIGGRANQIQRDLAVAKADRDQAQSEFDSFLRRLKIVEAENPQLSKLDFSSSQAGLLKRYKILHRLMDGTNTGYTGEVRDEAVGQELIYLTIALIVLIEITPLLAQSFMPLGPYDSWLSEDYKKMPELAERVISIHNKDRLDEWTYDEVGEASKARAHDDKKPTVRSFDAENPIISKKPIKAMYNRIKENVERRNLIIVILIVCFACAIVFGVIWFISDIQNAVAVGGVLATISGVLVPVMTRVAGVEVKE